VEREVGQTWNGAAIGIEPAPKCGPKFKRIVAIRSQISVGHAMFFWVTQAETGLNPLLPSRLVTGPNSTDSFSPPARDFFTAQRQFPPKPTTKRARRHRFGHSFGVARHRTSPAGPKNGPRQRGG